MRRLLFMAVQMSAFPSNSILHMKTTMVIAESHGLLRDLLALAVSSEVQMKLVGFCASGFEVMTLCGKMPPDVLLIGCALEDMNCVSLLRKVRVDHPDMRVLMLAGDGSVEVLRLPMQEQPQGIFHRNDPLPVFYEVLRAVVRGACYFSKHSIHQVNGAGHQGWAPPTKLTDREREVLALLAHGRSSKQIALELKLSPKTVDHYRAGIMKKLGIHDIASLTRHALRTGLVTLE
ncbi:MAG: response regulator transcription factor [Prosthecobacter sp.]